ncbi:MAG TPA: dihydrodipicolinate synthase family protein [Blastocatellia bacterium]|nr:dihydrodipicolinate synthase family protein [Blastocatellia bacterium]
MNYKPKSGLNVPVITVLDDSGRVIADEQRRVIRHVVQNGYGANVVFGVGTTGEWNRIANAERRRIMEIEVDEVRRINAERRGSRIEDRGSKIEGRTAYAILDPRSSIIDSRSVEAWVGVNGSTRAEILDNMDAAVQLGADAAVIAPLAVEDLAERDIVRFFQRDIAGLIEASKRDLPIFLYDNADINAQGQPPHIRTRIVKHLSRLPWVRGVKVSASRRVIGNYTKAALHYKLPGEFGIYIGNAMLIFEMYRPSHGLLGRLREGWRDHLLHYTPPIGVVSGPANCMPREWQKAWRVCWAGDDELTDFYKDLCSRFEEICGFDENGRRVMKTIACIKCALELDCVISSTAVGRGTRALSDEQKKTFSDNYHALRHYAQKRIDANWRTVADQA